MKGYKAFDKDLKCGDEQYVVGKVISHCDKIKLGGDGFHFCKELVHTARYPLRCCQPSETRYCEIRATGKVILEGSRAVTDEMEIVRELSWDEVEALSTGQYEMWNGTKEYYLNWELHREDGPALESRDGTKMWFLNGKLHRVGGPAVETGDGAKEMYGRDMHKEYGAKMWYLNGVLQKKIGEF